MFELQLRKLRKEAGLTQAELGKKLNVTLRVVSSWETGDSSLSFFDAFRICEALDCSLEELAGEHYKRETKSRIETQYENLDEDSKAAIDEQLEFQRAKTLKRKNEDSRNNGSNSMTA